MAELDRNRPFGTIHGIVENGAAFEQDGKLFNVQGQEIAVESEDAPAEEAEAVKAPKTAKPVKTDKVKETEIQKEPENSAAGDAVI